MRVGVYAGSFDPLTNGHIDIILRSLKLFDRLIVAVASGTEKQSLFSISERQEMIRKSIQLNERIEIDDLDGLLVEYARKRGACAIIRGIRAFSDFEYEFRMALMNRNLAPDIETIFLMPSEDYSYLSSSLIKEIVSLGGSVKDFVPPAVEEKLKMKYGIH
ncbi:phosphopantetheine adenylyltransferase [candidate division TA06 bacterium DG_26]|uniref:Phosphopantetheine adenylyltransferase n=1 Tax=candidate division TA06 bacterium DG_26 TaxID=1703771 RepID=A0A0S7WIG8_UNCT6|nr:MAG: phosphopantetheine adenylyltransferase [candidate division TA06 bacterium DG_26]